MVKEVLDTLAEAIHLWMLGSNSPHRPTETVLSFDSGTLLQSESDVVMIELRSQ